MSGGFAHPPPVLLEVQTVSKAYGALMALDKVSLQVSEGEFVVLLGPNGAGKTTLFQLLTGLFVADRGHVRVHGYDIRQHPTAALARLGVVFQQPALDLDMSVRANLLFHARLHGIAGTRVASRIDQELQRLQMLEQAELPCRQLSGGNRRKVELARALLPEPQLLLMDEPTAGLDPASRRSLLDYVQLLCAEQGIGVLWATHLVDEAEHANRVLVLHRGALLRSSSPTALVSETGERDLADAFMKLTAATTRLAGEPSH